MDKTPDGRPFPTCYDCGGQWSWTERDYRHTATCSREPKPKRYPEVEQDRHEVEAKKESGACPAHGFASAIECPTCLEQGGDLDHWTPEGDFG